MSADEAVSAAEGGTVPTLLCRQAGGIVPGSELDLDADEVAHVRVLRLREGDPVELTDGRGARWRGRMTDVDRRRARCVALEPVPVVEPWAIELWAPVGQRERSLWLVEKATEIGIRAIRLVEWERSRSVADAGRSDGFVAKAVRRAESALKQSGGSRLPEIEPPAGLDSLLGRAPEAVRLLADPAGSAPRSVIAVAGCVKGAVLLVGPEGGVTSRERDRCLAAGCVPVRLGPRTLRFETAAIVGLSCVAAALEERGTERPASTDPRAEDSNQGGSNRMRAG